MNIDKRKKNFIDKANIKHNNIYDSIAKLEEKL